MHSDERQAMHDVLDRTLDEVERYNRTQPPVREVDSISTGSYINTTTNFKVILASRIVNRREYNPESKRDEVKREQHVTAAVRCTLHIGSTRVLK